MWPLLAQRPQGSQLGLRGSSRYHPILSLDSFLCGIIDFLRFLLVEDLVGMGNVNYNVGSETGKSEILVHGQYKRLLERYRNC